MKSRDEAVVQWVSAAILGFFIFWVNKQDVHQNENKRKLEKRLMLDFIFPPFLCYFVSDCSHEDGEVVLN